MKNRRFPLPEFFSRESSSGLLIIIAAVIGVALANSPLADRYFAILKFEITFPRASFFPSLTILKVINYLLMTLFFFVVGLEIKRELILGNLASAKKAITPFIAALGGMLLPALVYLLISGSRAPTGWAVPVATDIALAVGLVSMMGSRVPFALKTFLLALAVIDDIGAILIIALLYSQGVVLSWLGGALLVIVIVFILKKLGIKSLWIYIMCGSLLWYAFYRASLHPTLAGVVMGLMAPTELKNSDQESSDETWIDWLERRVHPLTSFIIVPLFALANSGISLSGQNLRTAASSAVAWGIFFGLVIGKPLGIALFSLLGVRAGIAEFPEGSRRPTFIAISSAAGIGFTVAIFIARLAFDDSQLQEIAITAVLAGSLASAAISAALFRMRK